MVPALLVEGPGGEPRAAASRAANGYDVLVLTVDAPVAGSRLREVRNGLRIPPSLTLRTIADVVTHPQWWVNLLTLSR